MWQAADLQALSGLSALEELDLGRLVLEDKAGTCEALAALPRLRRLDLAGTNLTDGCLSVLQRMRGPLTHLQLNSNFRLTGEPASAQRWGAASASQRSHSACPARPLYRLIRHPVPANACRGAKGQERRSQLRAAHRRRRHALPGRSSGSGTQTSAMRDAQLWQHSPPA